ncbi:MICOS complex subunit MIC60 isoform X1 [Austrofundulus limnaeus]|uniref:MICOS complex subunit MIC60 n=1 Tax=Austrofundulus limnaeus TaxID=52670 RepID=A0A2I4BHZ2_AUSLI|nr:PREDICTED: MICOS complex subunit MIC60-like [Austrofundulus limnaeus]XP_013888597.1 PREDICTED: MICOS complex subunit MIC60-like isoform X1 [Austrofundulus limnaeus]
MLRICLRGARSTARRNCGRSPLSHAQASRHYTTGQSSGASKVLAAGLLTVGAGLGGTILYAKLDQKFRAAVEKNVPYSDQLFSLVLGPAPQDAHPLFKKQVESRQPPSMLEKQTKTSKAKPESPSPQSGLVPAQSIQEASAEATQIISAISEVPSVPAPCDSQAAAGPEDCEHCHEHPSASSMAHHDPEPAGSAQPIKERPGEEVAARLAQQDQKDNNLLAFVSASLEESLASSAQAMLQAIGAQEAALQAISQHTQKLKEAMEAEAPFEEKSAQWKNLEAALVDRTTAEKDARAALQKANEVLDGLKSVIQKSKDLKLREARPLILAAEENLHKMVVDLDKVVSKVQSAESEAKIVSQYSELVNEAKQQFQREVSSLTPDIQANWKGLTGKLSADDLNALIAHAHRRIDQLNRELAEQRVREQVHMDRALQQQKLEDQKMLEKAVDTAMLHVREEARLEQERKASELREVMEAEMRTQLRRQAAAHTDHVRDVLKVQEQELKAEAEQDLSSKMMEQETRYRQLTQEQLDNFTLDMNAAYARLKGIEEAIDSHVVAEEEARRAHQLWLSVEALGYTLKTAGAESPSAPLEDAAQAVRASCGEDAFASALASALPEESLRRGVYSEASLRARFNALRGLARRVALVDESHNSLYQYFLSYVQAALLFEDQQEAPPSQLSREDLDPFKLLSYASYCLEHGDLELAAKLVNQLQGEARRVAEDWLTEARLTLETRQVVSLLSAYANAVGLGTTQAP